MDPEHIESDKLLKCIFVSRQILKITHSTISCLEISLNEFEASQQGHIKNLIGNGKEVCTKINNLVPKLEASVNYDGTANLHAIEKPFNWGYNTEKPTLSDEETNNKTTSTDEEKRNIFIINDAKYLINSAITWLKDCLSLFSNKLAIVEKDDNEVNVKLGMLEGMDYPTGENSQQSNNNIKEILIKLYFAMIEGESLVKEFSAINRTKILPPSSFTRGSETDGKAVGINKPTSTTEVASDTVNMNMETSQILPSIEEETSRTQLKLDTKNLDIEIGTNEVVKKKLQSGTKTSKENVILQKINENIQKTLESSNIFIASLEEVFREVQPTVNISVPDSNVEYFDMHRDEFSRKIGSINLNAENNASGLLFLSNQLPLPKDKDFRTCLAEFKKSCSYISGVMEFKSFYDFYAKKNYDFILACIEKAIENFISLSKALLGCGLLPKMDKRSISAYKQLVTSTKTLSVALSQLS